MNTEERRFITLKDLVLDVLLSCLVLAIAATVVPLFTPLGLFLSSILALITPAVLGGPIYVLMTSKSPRIGTYLIFSVIFGVFFLISGSLVTALFFVGAGLLAELSMLGNRKKKWRALAPYLIHWFFYTYAATAQMIFMQNVVVRTYMGMGMDEAAATAAMNSIAEVYTAPVNMLIVGVCALASGTLGYFLGTRVMKRHFEAAGVV